MSKHVTQAIKDAVANRASFRCEYCFSPSSYSHDPFCIEHIIPKTKGGTDELDNLAFSCNGCNNFKFTHTHAVDSLTGKVSRLYHPRKDDWQKHFRWSNDEIEIVGISPIGRATVERLKLNRTGVVNFRSLLKRAGKHPPENS